MDVRKAHSSLVTYITTHVIGSCDLLTYRILTKCCCTENLKREIKKIEKEMHIRNTHCPTPASESTLCTKVWEPNQFDGTDPRKLRVFLVQCELNFQDRPKVFHTNCAKVIFTQSYLKGMVLEWFEPDLLQMEDPTLCPL